MKLTKALCHLRTHSIVLPLAVIALVAGCRSENLLDPPEKATIILPPDEEMTNIGDFYYKNYDMMARDLTNQIAKRLRAIQKTEKRKSTIVVGTIKNETPFNIDTREFGNDIADGLLEMGVANVYYKTIPDKKDQKRNFYIVGGNIQSKDKVVGNKRERAFRLRLNVINYDDVDSGDDDSGRLIMSKKALILKRAWLDKEKDK